MALGRYLADKSAFVQQRHSDAAAGLLSALAADGALFMTEMVALELLYSARSSDDYDARREDLLSLPWLHLTQAVAARPVRRSAMAKRSLVDSGRWLGSARRR